MTEITRKRLVSDSAWSVTAAVLNSLFGFGYLLIIGNYWKSEGIGIFSLCVSMYLIGSLLFNVGVHNAVLYEVAAAGDDKKRASEFVYSALLSSFVLGILGGCIGFVLASQIANAFDEPSMKGMVRLFSFALPLFLINKTTTGVLNAHRRMRVIVAASAIRGAVIMLYLIGVAISKGDLAVIPYGFILAELAIAVLLLIACLRTHAAALPCFGRIKSLISFGWKAGLSGVIGDINVRLDILVIGLFWDASIVGVYTVASAAAKGLWLMPGAVQRVTNPLIVQLHSAGEKVKLHRTMDVLFRLGVTVFAVICMAMIVYIKPLMGLCYPGEADMMGVAVPLYFLLPGAAIFAGVSMIGSAPSNSIAKPENALKLVCLVCCVNLLMNFTLVPFFAAAGAAVATTISLLAAVVYFFYLCKRYLDFSLPMIRISVLFLVICCLIGSVAIFEGVIWRGVLLAGSLAVIIVTLVVSGLVRKSDIDLIRSIAQSFGKGGS